MKTQRPYFSRLGANHCHLAAACLFLWLLPAPRGWTQAYVYDTVNELTRVRYDATRQVDCRYDANGYLTNLVFAGNLTEEDTDGDGMADAWEYVWFNNLTNTATGDYNADTRNNLWEYQHGTDPTAPDTDGDGMSNVDENYAGTSPTNAHSCLQFEGLSAQPVVPALVLRWQSVNGKQYTVARSTNLLLGFPSNLYLHVPGSAPYNAVTVTPAAAGPWLYRIRVE